LEKHLEIKSKDSNTVPNSTCKKLAVQGLNEAFYFVLSVVLAHNLVLRNPFLRQALKTASGNFKTDNNEK
jgi:hypothetical protein